MRQCQHLTLFPYTTLFRSLAAQSLDEGRELVGQRALEANALSARRMREAEHRSMQCEARRAGHEGSRGLAAVRSEEHTSELQSQSNLVCRLLLEKKSEVM